MIARIALPLLLALPGAALADETWHTDGGEAVYEADIGEIAVFSIPGETGRINLYLEGLGGNYDDRSAHRGYWIGPGPGECSAALGGPDGRTSDQWGRVVLMFDRAAAPTGWTALLGRCLDEPADPVRADLY